MKRVDHSYHQTDLPVKLQILNISVNLERLSQWVFESYDKKRELIQKFMDQTENFVSDLHKQKIHKLFKPTLTRFESEFKDLKGLEIHEDNKRWWAEKALTWANILQHRAKLA